MFDVFPTGLSALVQHDIFFDYNATTPLDLRVLEVMLPYYGAAFGNPHSVGYARAEMSRTTIEQARGQVAHLIGAEHLYLGCDRGLQFGPSRSVRKVGDARQREEPSAPTLQRDRA